MKSQISRHSFNARKRYSGVYQQQGRMITDADWNELSEIAKRRLDEALEDVVGSGAPKGRGASLRQAGAGQPVEIDGGRVYAGGVGAEVVAASDPEAASFGLDDQADFPGCPPPAAGSAVYVDVWERPVISLEDPEHLRDAALHGADTATRTQTMAQVKWCPAATDPESPAVNPALGDAELSLALRSILEIEDPCDPCAAVVASEGRTGNYLFRLEVHDVVGDPGAPSQVTLKWSSENGAEQHDLGAEPADFGVADRAYEFFDDTTEKHLGVHLAPGFPPAREALEAGFPADLSGRRARVRRWDGFCVLARSGAGVWSLVDGRDRGVSLPQPGTAANPPHGFVQVGSRLVVHLERIRLDLRLAGRTFLAGDYWLAAVREAVASGGDPLLDEAPPLGIRHHYVRLGSLDAAGNLVELETPRRRQLAFPPLSALEAGDVGYSKICDSGLFDASHDTVKKALDRLCQIDAEHIGYAPAGGCQALAGTTTVDQALDRVCGNAALYHVGGDGQEGVPGDLLPANLETRVAVGRFAEAGRRVRYRIVLGSGSLQTLSGSQSGAVVTVTTDGGGLAAVRWRLGNEPAQRVEAAIVDAAGNQIAPGLAFNAGLRGGDSADPGVRIEELVFASGNGLRNEVVVPVTELANGLTVVCDREVDARCFELKATDLPTPARPNFEVSLYMPYPLGEVWELMGEPVGFRPVVLGAEVRAEDNLIQWRPRPQTEKWLAGRLFPVLEESGQANRLLVLIRLRGNFVWAREGDPAEPGLYIDGEAFGRAEDGARVGLRLPSGNRRSGGEFLSWFWVEPNNEPPVNDFQVEVSGSRVFGTLTDGNNQPVLGVLVELGGSGTTQQRATTTDAQGRFQFLEVPPGSYTVSARIGGEILTSRVTVGRVGPGRLGTGGFIFDRELVEDRPLREVRGVGPVTEGALSEANIRTAADLAMADPRKLAGRPGLSLGESKRLVREARLLVLGSG